MYNVYQAQRAVFQCQTSAVRGGGGSQRQANCAVAGALGGFLAGQETIEGHDDAENELDSDDWSLELTYTPTRTKMLRQPVCKYRKFINQEDDHDEDQKIEMEMMTTWTRMRAMTRN